MNKRPKRAVAEDIPYVTINGQKIDARDRHALDEAFKQVARQRAVNRCYIAFCGLADISNGRGEIEPGQSNVGAIHDTRTRRFSGFRPGLIEAVPPSRTRSCPA